MNWFKKIGLVLPPVEQNLKNRFSLNEWSGAIGDLGTFLPLIFALIVFNGFPVARLFFLFGLVYFLTGWFYKVPVSVQPLKAMSVIAIAKGFDIDFLAGTAFFYGLLMFLLSVTGMIKWLQKLFSQALVHGIQAGIGLILAGKAVELVLNKGFLLQMDSLSNHVNMVLLVVFLLIIGFFQMSRKKPVGIILVAFFMILFAILKIEAPLEHATKSLIDFSFPSISMLKDAVVYLMIPQLPLTLGNAVYAASDTCHDLWKKQAQKVNPTRLAFSIGVSDLFIGLAGGFPICHGAGGMGAHRQFGGKTGGATIIMGGILVLAAFVPNLASLIFLIPVPLLAAMLMFDSYRMIRLMGKSRAYEQWITAATVAGISFFTRNLSLALAVGFVLEKLIILINKKIIPAEGVGND